MADEDARLQADGAAMREAVGGVHGGDARVDAPFRFAVGCVRSGTTMLRAMLDSHPDLAVPPESYFVAPTLHRRHVYETGGGETGAGIDLDRLLADVTADPSFGDWHLEPAYLDAVRRPPSPTSVAGALARLYSAYASAHGKSSFADRTPSNIMEIELLARELPGSRFVHLVRDGRDVVPSIVDMTFGPGQFAAAVLFWRTRVMRGRIAGRGLDRSRYLEIRYEDLVADPEASLTGVTAFYGLEYSPAMLDYHERAGQLIGGLRNSGHVQGVRRPPTVGLRDWRTAMPPHQVQLFEALAGDALDAFGYERSGLPATTRVKLEAVMHRTARRLELRARTLRTRVGRRLGRSHGGSA